MPADATLRILVWSDYVCPFCYLERPVLDQVRSELGEKVEIDWRAFELRPEPTPTLDPDGEYLHRVWNQSVYPMAQARGMSLRLPPVQPYSRKAHEAAEFAREAGRLDAMNAALFKAFFEEGRDLADPDVLLDIARSVGLDADALREALGDGRYTRGVLEDQRLAQEIGISGVPALVVSAGEQAYLLSGAQPYETVREVIERALGSVGGAVAPPT
ncbi:DsbA family oxidoreductase [Microvirga lenta]|uniref:DsbA family oxidoreductase n=1 Tax=Microvirga lenta TaxID=2881337 RepID=UPI001CFFB614|nr:DsbA family oxidoreductase [Microvirga lenta]MCB5174981.1 DsbA family oxidoreductase [Microvirga lenta]